MVYKAGDVIPRIEAPVVHLRTGDEQPIAFPEACPQCGDAHRHLASSGGGACAAVSAA